MKPYHLSAAVALLFLAGCTNETSGADHDELTAVGGSGADLPTGKRYTPPNGGQACVAGVGYRTAGESCIGADGVPDPSLCDSCACSSFVPHVGGPELSACGKIDTDASGAGTWLPCGDKGDACSVRVGGLDVAGDCHKTADNHYACCPIDPVTDPVSGTQDWKRCAD